MPTLDELRGTKEGTTKKSSSTPRILKEAAVSLGVTAATMTPAAAMSAENNQSDDAKHQIEVTVEKKAQKEDSATYYMPAKENETPASEEIISVNYQDGLYSVTGVDGKTTVFSEAELANKPAMKENIEHWKAFSKPTKYKDIELNNVEDLAENSYLAAFDPKNNRILTYKTELSREDIQEQLVTSMQKGEDLQKIGNAYHRVVELEQVQNNPDARKSFVEHEETHRDDAASGALKKAQVTAEQACKLDMGTEINATLTQIKMGYDKYKESGNIDDIQGWHAGDLKDFKDWLVQNPHMPEQEIEKQLVKSAYEGWLNQNNQNGTPYYEQAVANSGMSSPEGVSVQKSAAAKFENPANIEQFHKQWEQIFKNTAFGDVRDIASADFEIGKGSQSCNLFENEISASEKFLNMVVDGVKNVKQGTHKLKKFFHIVKKVDKDGVRTPQEDKKLGKAFRAIQQKRGISQYAQAEKKSQSSSVENTRSDVIQAALRQNTQSSR